MKPIKFAILILICLSSCAIDNNTDENQVITLDSNVAQIGNSVEDQEMIEQLNIYLEAFISGNSDVAISYIHPGVYDYMKEQYPDNYSREMIERFIKEPIEQLKIMGQEQGMTFEFKIGEIKNHFVYGNDKINTVITKMTAKRGLNEFTFGDGVIAIKNENFDTWKFIQLDEESSPKILRLKYPETLVEKIIKLE